VKKTYKGSCHCGKVRFEADLDLSAGTVKCNCSVCAKQRSWLAAVGPNNVRLLSDEAELADYQFGARRIHHRFRRTCGVRPFGQANMEDRAAAFYAISLGALDDVDPAELANAPVMYVDGRHDNWESAPPETRHL
jgi:hypothetical protein